MNLDEVINRLDRTDIFSAAVVGNGISSRAWGDSRSLPAICLQGAMGMAAPVAAGIAAVRCEPVLVVEGDGNFVLGSPAAAWIEEQNLPILHVVLVNGIYQSSGGQLLPLVPQIGRAATSLSQVSEIIEQWSLRNGYLRFAVEGYNTKSFPRIRRTLSQQVTQISQAADQGSAGA